MTHEAVSRYPLSWPTGWKRTEQARRRSASFKDRNRGPLSVSSALGRLQREIDRLGSANAVLSTNVKLRIDGWPMSNQPEPADPGAAVYFELVGEKRCLACDRWFRVADNIAAIAAHIEALRGIDRWGVGTMEQAFTGYTALTHQAEADWRLELGLTQARVRVEDVDEAFRREARRRHPDVGGSHDAMARLNTARDAALRELQPRERAS